MSRNTATVFYTENDIHFIGEYNGRIHSYGYSVNFKTDDGKTLKWYTTIPPQKYNGVEKYTRVKVKISFSYVKEDDFGNIIVRNVRFLNTEN